jgi:hypothetical protein
MHIDYYYYYIRTRRFIFHYKFINIWHHICFLWWDCDRSSMLMTCPQRRYEETSEDVTWRDVDRTSIMNITLKQMGPPASMKLKWHLNERRQLTPKTSWRLKSIKSTLIFMCMSETKRERVAHWLSVFNIVIFYFDNFDMIL